MPIHGFSASRVTPISSTALALGLTIAVLLLVLRGITTEIQFGEANGILAARFWGFWMCGVRLQICYTAVTWLAPPMVRTPADLSGNMFLNIRVARPPHRLGLTDY